MLKNTESYKNPVKCAAGLLLCLGLLYSTDSLAAAPAESPKANKGQLDINLIAVAEFQERQTALIEDKSTGVTAFYRPGDMIYGWKFASIQPRDGRIIMEKNGVQEYYALYAPPRELHAISADNENLQSYLDTKALQTLRSANPTRSVSEILEGTQKPDTTTKTSSKTTKETEKPTQTTVNLGGGRFIRPVTDYKRISSPFGTRRHPVSGRIKSHTGLDISASTGTNIYAADSGQVTFSGWRGGYGRCIIIDHHNGYSTLYGHMSRTLVSAGTNVSRGATIGKVGSTGVSTGPHLHFEIRQKGTPINPARHVKY